MVRRGLGGGRRGDGFGRLSRHVAGGAGKDTLGTVCNPGYAVPPRTGEKPKNP